MEIQISGRGTPVSAELRRRVELQVSRAARVLPKVVEARVVLARERHRHLAEVTLKAKGATLHAEGSAAELHAALDVAVENLSQQARRRKDRLRERKPRPSRRGARIAAPGPEAAPEGAGTEPEILVRRLAAKPLSVDEAVELMRERRDGVLVFTNARSGAVNVLHRRRDGQLELVQPSR